MIRAGVCLLEGGVVKYTITVKNDGPATASGVVVQQYLSEEFPFANASSNNGACDEATGKWKLADALAPGTSAVLTLTFDTRGCEGGSITNTATIAAADQHSSSDSEGVTSTVELEQCATPPVSPAASEPPAPTALVPSADATTASANPTKDELASTGFDAKMLGVLALLIALLGAGIMLTARRRRSSRH
ncbi:DUF11 domain-containing protein [Specibacter sp. AOP5-B1-6]|uniref:DUF11 domain-containing protein n=1 Tax=Specibacter sp. AOP5-B1-6 TaxID=3457653 RepID=UPI00402B5EC0